MNNAIEQSHYVEHVDVNFWEYNEMEQVEGSYLGGYEAIITIIIFYTA